MIEARALRLYLVTDRGLAGGRPLPDIVRAAVAGGVTMVQLREKDLGARAFLDQALALKAALAGSGVPLIVNDRVDIALAAGADGVHLGEDDLPARKARALMGPDAIIGLSALAVPLPDEIEAVDYVAASPVFATPTKTDTGPALGLAGLRSLAAASSRPVLAIGGLNEGNAASVVAHGAAGIAVVSAIMAAPAPFEAARALRRALERTRG